MSRPDWLDSPANQTVITATAHAMALHGLAERADLLDIERVEQAGRVALDLHAATDRRPLWRQLRALADRVASDATMQAEFPGLHPARANALDRVAESADRLAGFADDALRAHGVIA